MQIHSNFLQSINDLQITHSSDQKKYLYTHENQVYASTQANVQANYTKLSVGQIVDYLFKNISSYSQQELKSLRTSFSTTIKTGLETKYSGNFFKRIYFSFLSSMCNLYKGFGFVNSLTLVNKALETIQREIDQFSIDIQGEICFSESQQSILSEVFSAKNIKLLRTREKEIDINGQKEGVTYYGINIPVFELNTFPDIIFKFHDSEKLNKSLELRYQAMQQAKKVCQEYDLNKLIVPDASLMTISSAEKNLFVIAEKKYPIEQGREAQKIQYENAELEIEDIIKQLTILICKIHFADVKWNNIPLMKIENILKVILLDLEPHENYTFKHGLIGWGKVRGFGEPTPGLMGCCPQYAEVIYKTTQEYLSKEEFEAIQPELDQAKMKADKINERRKSIESFHQKRKIISETPAISLEDNLSSLDLEDGKLKGAKWVEIIQDINEVIAKQTAKYPSNLVRAREWRLTADEYSDDGNRKSRIPHNFFEIRKVLTQLQTLGYVHSLLKHKKAEELDIDVRRRIGEYDLIVQF